jgi:hypothetical protein
MKEARPVRRDPPEEIEMASVRLLQQHPLLGRTPGTYVGRLIAEVWSHPGTDRLSFTYLGPGFNVGGDMDDRVLQDLHAFRAADHHLIASGLEKLIGLAASGEAPLHWLPAAAKGEPAVTAREDDPRMGQYRGRVVIELWQSNAGTDARYAIEIRPGTDGPKLLSWTLPRLRARLD